MIFIQNNTTKTALFVLVSLMLLTGLFFVFRSGKETATNKPLVSENVVENSPSAPPTQQATSSESGKSTIYTTVTPGGFDPSEVTIKTGNKVVWTNRSGDFVTVSSDPHPTHTDYPPLNLGRFDDGASVELVFDKAGTYTYHNHLNPAQKGKVVVSQ